MKKRLFLILIVFTFMMTSLSPLLTVKSASTDDLNKLYSDLQALEKKQTALNKEIADAKSQKQLTIEQKNRYDKEIDNTQNQIKTLNTIISGINKQLNEKDDELASANDELERYYDLYRQRIRANYEADRASYLDVVFGSKSFSDFLSRLDLMAQIVEYDNQLMANMKTKITTITAIRNEIDQKKKENDAAKEKMKTQQSNLQAKLNESDKLIKDLNGDIKELEKLYTAMEKAEAQLNSQISSLRDKDKVYVGGKLAWPVPGYTTITSPFGMRIHPITKTLKMHYGIDISGSGISGKKVVAANDGVVIFAGYTTYEGNVISIDHGGGLTTQYKHLKTMYVGVGANVKKNDGIGEVGSTGYYSTGAHLHFEVSENGTRVNPMNYYK